MTTTITNRLTEDSIRPDALMQQQDALHAEDLQWLIARGAEFVDVPCPACESMRNEPLWTKDGFRYVRCTDCRTGFLSPRPGPDLLDEYYRTAQNYVFWREKVFPASEDVRRERIARPRVDRIRAIAEQYGLKRPSVMEVGAGYGTFCQEAVNSGAFSRVVAVEPTPPNAAMCRERGLEVIELPVEQISVADGAVDVIASFEVIEHLFRPAQFLGACRRMLRKGGLLALTCPSIDGFDVMTLGTTSQVIDAEHLNYFHPESLALLVSRCGFEVLEVTTPGKLDAEIVRKRTLAGLHDLSGEAFLHRVLIEKWEQLGDRFQEFLASNGLSSHMWIVARRP